MTTTTILPQPTDLSPSLAVYGEAVLLAEQTEKALAEARKELRREKSRLAKEARRKPQDVGSYDLETDTHKVAKQDLEDYLHEHLDTALPQRVERFVWADYQARVRVKAALEAVRTTLRGDAVRWDGWVTRMVNAWADSLPAPERCPGCNVILEGVTRHWRHRELCDKCGDNKDNEF